MRARMAWAAWWVGLWVTSAVANPGQTALADRLRAAVPIEPGDAARYDRNTDGLLDAGDVIGVLLSPVPTPSPSPTPLSSPTPTVTPSPTPTGAQEARLAYHGIGTAYDAAVYASDAVELAVRLVFLASQLAGTTAVTGTLTSTDSSDNNFTYSNQPTDRLVVISFSGRRLEFRFFQLIGNTSSADNFIAEHQMRFTVLDPGRRDVEITSQKGYTRAWRAAWQRTITGQFLSAEEMATINLTHQGTEEGSIEPPFTDVRRSETHTGTIQAPSASVQVNESSFFLFIQNSSQGIIVQNKSLTSNSTATTGGATYAFENVRAPWESFTRLNDPGQFNVVQDAAYWQAGGQVRKNGAVWGTAGFSGPVVPGTKGPDFVLTLQGTGERVLLHTLIPDL